MGRNELLERVKSRMPEKRFIHTIGVMETAIQLAEKYGADVKAAETAAILHDVAKYADEEWMKTIVRGTRPGCKIVGLGSGNFTRSCRCVDCGK